MFCRMRSLQLFASLSTILVTNAEATAWFSNYAYLALKAQSGGDIWSDLGPQLSENATIYYPGQSEFADRTARWNDYGKPSISVVVEAGTEEDVAKIVKYANQVDLPFLAVNRGHGSPNTMSLLQHGIQISMNQLNWVNISDDGDSASLGGGILGGTMLQELTKNGKVSSTGSCHCVGLMGAGLGGGHSRLQGYFGLIIDNMIELNVVLWNGTRATVSETSNPDLFWGMRGAGHNFGIVTSLRYKIYDLPSEDWFYATYTFTEDKLESVVDEVNRLSNAGIPPEVASLNTNVLWDTSIREEEPIVQMQFSYAGLRSDAASYIEPFLKLEPLTEDEGNTSYLGLAKLIGTDEDGPLCERGLQRMQFSSGLVAYNTTAMRAALELYKEVTIPKPEYRGGVVAYQAYSVAGMQKVPYDSTAYAHRGDSYIWTFILSYQRNETLDATAIEWGERYRSLILDGQPPNGEYHVYINYAFGNEPLESIYGYDAWRMEKLRGLKREWDPYNKFGYYLSLAEV